MLNPSFELQNQAKSILVFGRDGQVGRALQIYLKGIRVPVFFLGRSDCDLSNESDVKELLNYYQPQVIINAAAYTAVDKAENEQDLAFDVNAKAPALMAKHISNVANGILIHYSTDFVFGDSKQSAYLEGDTVGPVKKLSVYGQSKLAGEEAIKNIFNFGFDLDRKPSHDVGSNSFEHQSSKYFILRTSWVYGDGSNFIRTILRRASEEDQLKVVDDQIGVPTSAEWLADVSLRMVMLEQNHGIPSGIYHAVPCGAVSRYALAKFLIETATSLGWKSAVKLENILPVPAQEYSSPAPRPYNSRLNNTKLQKVLSLMAFAEQYPRWEDQVTEYMKKNIQNF